MSALEKTTALRTELWNDVLKTDAYRAFTALDNAVVAMGGDRANRLILATLTVKPALGYANAQDVAAVKRRKVKRITQSQIAERVLKRAGEPLPVGRWLAACIADGINIKGGDPLPKATLDSIHRTQLALKGPLTTLVGGGFRSVNVRLREEFRLYANLRPGHCRQRPG